MLDALNTLGQTSQIDLARECDITAASMSTMTSRLIDAGYVSRVSDPINTRSNMLSLTPLGLALVDDIHQTWTEVDSTIENLLGLEKSETMANLTRDLCRALGGRAPGAK